MALRMKDIAESLGVSVVTVSKAVNGHLDISEATRQRVLRRMKELNYTPSLRARSLVSGKSYILGFVVPDLVHAFFSEIAVSLSSVIRDQGYSLLISASNESAEVENTEILQMLRHGVDGILLASCQAHPDDLMQVQNYNIPLLLVDRSFPETEFAFIGANDILIGEMATEHLIELGRRRIAHIGGGTVSTSRDRLQGYRQTLKKHNIQLPAEYIVRRHHIDESSDVTSVLAMKRLLQLPNRPDAVFCHNDPTAIGAMNAILDAGLKIPEDIALIGCGNIRYSESLRVPLSTIDVSTEALGRRAGEIILKQIASGKPATGALLKPRLIPRQSTVGVRKSREAPRKR
jgi:LacI family transcriptional regulator